MLNEPEYDILINKDSIDIEHITLEDESPGIKLTSIDVDGDPTHHAYNLESLSIMIEDLKIAQESLLRQVGEDYVI